MAIALAAATTHASTPTRSREEPAHRAIVLGRHNTIIGRRSGVVAVSIPAPARLDVHLMPGRHEGPNPSIELSGRGRSVGFVLVPADLPDDLLSGVVTSARFTRCRSRGCEPRGRTVQFLWPRVIGSKDHLHTIEPGRYRLYLIADHARVRVRFTLKGLSGATTIRMVDEPEIDVRSPRVRTEIRGERSVYSAGSTYRAAGNGFVVSALWAYARPFRGATWGMCSYRVPAKPPGELAFGPGCSAPAAIPQVGAGTFGNFSGGDNNRGFSVTTISTHRPDPTGLLTRRAVGAWYISPGRTRVIGSQAFSVEL